VNFEQAPEFRKELKRLAKKWRSLPLDVTDAQLGLIPLYVPQDGVDIKLLREAFFATKRATILQEDKRYEVVKMRLDCASLNGSDKIRIVFVAIRNGDTIKFIELYSKNEKSREDPKRIQEYIS
jgi:hypothetical protein